VRALQDDRAYLDQIAGEVEGKATVAKVNVDENGDLSSRFGIRSIPTLGFSRTGRVVDQTSRSAPRRIRSEACSRSTSP
jgi:thioredoxin 1